MTCCRNPRISRAHTYDINSLVRYVFGSPCKYLSATQLSLFPSSMLNSAEIQMAAYSSDIRPFPVQYLQRNERMVEWGAQFPGRVLTLDFDAMSHATNPPPTTINWDKHYMCYVTYPRAGSDVSALRETLMTANGLRERVFSNPVRPT